MIDLKAICDALAARYAPGTMSTPTGAAAIRSASGRHPKDVVTVPMAYVDVENGDLIANPGQWKHEISLDLVFVLSKRPGDPVRVDEQRQRWLPSLLAATQAQMKLGLGGASGYTVDKAIPAGWEFTEETIGATEYDSIRVHYTVYVTENVTLTP